MDPPLKVHIHTLKNFVPSPKDDFLTQFLIFGSVLAILAKMGNFGKIGGPPLDLVYPPSGPPLSPPKIQTGSWTPPKNIFTHLDPP